MKFDIAQGIGSGRPTIFNTRIVDCEYPADSATPLDDDIAIPTCASELFFLFVPALLKTRVILI